MKALALLLALASTAGADEWTAGDTALQVTYAATLGADYLQTRQGIKGGWEQNPIMGHHGERVPPEVYFPVAFAVHTTLMVLTPKPYRGVVQGISIGVSSMNVARNWQAGWAVKF